MQKGFDVDIRRKQWVLDMAPRPPRGGKETDERLLEQDPPGRTAPTAGILAATHLLQGAFSGAITVPTKAQAAPPRQAPAAPPEPARPPEPVRRGAVPASGLLHLYCICLGTALLVAPAFLNYGPQALHAIVVCVTPLLLPTVALHLLVTFLDGLRLAPFCGLAAFTGGILLAVLMAHGVSLEHCRWGVHLCVLLLQAAYTLSLRERGLLVSMVAFVLFAVPVGILEAGPWHGTAGVDLVFAWQVFCLSVFATWSAAQYRALDLALTATRHVSTACAA